MRHAQEAGAAAVLVFDSVEEPLVRMMASSRDGGAGITIPAVSVTHTHIHTYIPVSYTHLTLPTKA